jgi:hypothetical protein
MPPNGLYYGDNLDVLVKPLICAAECRGRFIMRDTAPGMERDMDHSARPAHGRIAMRRRLQVSCVRCAGKGTVPDWRTAG